MTFKESGLPEVDAGGVEADCFDLSVFTQPTRSIRMQSGKVKICHCGGAAFVSSQVSLSIGVKLSKSSAKEHYRPRWYLSVSFLPILEIACGDQVVMVF